MTIDISTIVSVSQAQAPVSTQRRDIGEGLFLTTDGSVLSASGANKMRRYETMDEVAADFGSTTEPYAAATAWFAQNPPPKALWVARWATSDVVTTLTGGSHGTVANLQASDAEFTIDGTNITVDTSGASTHAAIATAIQAALIAASNTDLDNCTVTYANNAYVLTLNGPEDIGYATAVSGGSGTDISGHLGWLSTSTGVVYQAGIAQKEEADEALDAIVAINDSPYLILPDVTIPDNPSGLTKATLPTIASWTETRGRYCAVLPGFGDASLVANETTSNLATLFDTQYDSVVTMWSSKANYKHVSAAARMSAIPWGEPGSFMSPFMKALPGFDGDTFTTTQKTELDRKRTNYHVDIHGYPVFLPGVVVKNDYWWDYTVFMDWLGDTIETEVFDTMRLSNNVPYTEVGLGVLADTINNVCRRARDAGAIAPGNLSVAMTANLRQVTGDSDHSGYLPNGYELYFPPISSVTDSQRASRVAPDGSLWLVGSGNIQKVSIKAQIV